MCTYFIMKMEHWTWNMKQLNTKHSAHYMFSQNILDLNVFFYYPLSFIRSFKSFHFQLLFFFPIRWLFFGLFAFLSVWSCTLLKYKMVWKDFVLGLCITYNDTVFVVITDVICWFHRFGFVAYCKWCTSTNRILVLSAHESLSQISVQFVVCSVFVYDINNNNDHNHTHTHTWIAYMQLLCLSRNITKCFVDYERPETRIWWNL